MPPKTISADLLRTLAVAGEGETLTDVARRVGLTQPAISLRLKKLEEELGVQLMRRTARGSELTAAGHLAHDYARRILQLNDEMLTAIAALRVEGNLRLGLPADLAETWLAGALAAFTSAHPQVHLEVVVDRNQVLIEQVGRGELDIALALTTAPPQAGAELLARLPLHWIGRPGQNFAADAELPLVLFAAPCMFRQAGIEALERSGRPWRVTMTSPSLAGLWAAVEAGLGIALRTPLGLPAALRVLDGGGLPALNACAHLALYRANGAEGPAVAALSRIARETLAEGA